MALNEKNDPTRHMTGDSLTTKHVAENLTTKHTSDLFQRTGTTAHISAKLGATQSPTQNQGTSSSGSSNSTSSGSSSGQGSSGSTKE